jgi:hypothetical protein
MRAFADGADILAVHPGEQADPAVRGRLAAEAEVAPGDGDEHLLQRGDGGGEGDAAGDHQPDKRAQHDLEGVEEGGGLGGRGHADAAPEVRGMGIVGNYP